MEILFLYRAISKHYISDAANDRDNLGKHCGKSKVCIARDLQFQYKYTNIYLFLFMLCMLKISISSAACKDRNFIGQSLEYHIQIHFKSIETMARKSANFALSK